MRYRGSHDLQGDGSSRACDELHLSSHCRHSLRRSNHTADTILIPAATAAAATVATVATVRSRAVAATEATIVALLVVTVMAVATT